ncbi:MAG: hypothetical protein IT537_08570 [Hyphomicrobiales bacterium]|nr:hypothetical protein [Hyphomicrobiales bacterium]
MSSILRKIVVSYWRKPIPTDRFDFIATYYDDEPNDNGSMAHGSGRTEAEAVLDLIDNYPLGVQCERDVRHCGHCGKQWWMEGDDDVPGDCPEFGCPLRDSEWDLPKDCTCSWRTTSVNSASIDPPEPYLHRDEWCPVHGRDPDEAYEAARDDARTFGRERTIYGEDF